ncbi:MAG: ribonuclease III [Candidatus Krumholzibacteria bacterium]
MKSPAQDFLQRIVSVFRAKPPQSPPGDGQDRLQATIGYSFRDRSLLRRALVHRSYAAGDAEKKPDDTSNERLEFLGDAVLSLVVNEFLFKKYSEKREGDLTKMKSVIVSKPILSFYAKKYDLGSFIFLSENAQKSRVGEADSVLADTLEAIFGAVFLDGGFEAASGCIRRVMLSDLTDIFYNEDNINYKSLLQEYIQALHKVPPRYQVRSTSGPEHDKEFAVEVGVKGTSLARGVGKTKKLAEQEAAKLAYKKLLNTDELLDLS